MCITVLGDDHNDDRDNNVDEVENNANINGSLDESWGCYCCGWSKNSILWSSTAVASSAFI